MHIPRVETYTDAGRDADTDMTMQVQMQIAATYADTDLAAATVASLSFAPPPLSTDCLPACRGCRRPSAMWLRRVRFGIAPLGASALSTSSRLAADDVFVDLSDLLPPPSAGSAWCDGDDFDQRPDCGLGDRADNSPIVGGQIESEDIDDENEDARCKDLIVSRSLRLLSLPSGST